MNGLEMSTEQLRQVVKAARRGVMVRPCAAADPPSVLILDCADFEHAKAITAYVSTFDPDTVTDLLDRLERAAGEAVATREALREIAAGPPDEGDTQLQGEYEEDARYRYPAREGWYHDAAQGALETALEVGG